MVVPDLAINQPAVTVVEIDDPTMAGAGIELLDLDAGSSHRYLFEQDGWSFVWRTARWCSTQPMSE